MRHSPTKLSPFEFRLFRRMESLRGSQILVACSGGIDSVALATCLARIKDKLGIRIALAHVHHGADQGAIRARDQAAHHVRHLARNLGLDFYLARRTGPELRGEEALREFRLRMLEKIRGTEKFDRIAFAHHADDLLETRLIRLVRGTGLQGLRAMTLLTDQTVRPFLEESRATLEEYARFRNCEWVSDPTNESSEPLRNFIRREWLPALEAKRPGASRAIARSFESMVDSANALLEDASENVAGNFVSRPLYNSLSITQRRQAIATLLQNLGVRSFGSSHIDEIRKRIEVPQKVIRFRVLKLDWEINAEQIRVITSSLPR